MTDLDFDELDRAVNSLIAPTAMTTKEPEAEKTLTITETDNSQPSFSTFTSTPVAARDAATTVTQPLSARRSSGRFMDVVHPSSDMRTMTPFASVSTGSMGPGITPLTPSAPIQNIAPSAEPISSPAPTNDWPDPIAFHSSTATSSSQPSSLAEIKTVLDADVADEDDDIDKIENDINSSFKDSPEALASPFLADAKVDKRPLGAFSSETAAATVTSMPTVELTQPVEPTQALEVEPHPQAPEAEPVILPEELQSHLLSIESDVNLTLPAEDETVSEPILSTGPTAITQQYKEEKSTSEEQSGAIFDTNSYHTALTPPAKKTSPLLWIMWVILLIVIGGGIGAAVYFFVLPMIK